MQKGNIWVNILSFVGAILILGVLIWYGVKLYKNKNFINTNQNINNPVATTTNENLYNVINNSSSSSGTIYKNTEFGIQFIIPNYIKDYKIIATTTEEYSGKDKVPQFNFYFPVPENDHKDYGPCNVDDYIHNGICYRRVFGIYSITEKGYNIWKNSCKPEEFNLSCPAPEIDEFINTGNYLYYYRHGNGGFDGGFGDSNNNNTVFMSEIFESLKPLTK
ncbi:MAG: hypothetical protein QG630_253 [Patescibacteria group bacterium]|nr:hypothetical protein [Patescibacteria group bacterium]